MVIKLSNEFKNIPITSIMLIDYIAMFIGKFEL